MDDFRAWVRARARGPARAAAGRRAHVGARRRFRRPRVGPRRTSRALAGSGLAVPSWPEEYGGLGATPEQVGIVRGELAAFAVPDLYPYLVGLELVGPTLLAHGRPDQCARWLPAIASGEEIWCQLFSEPGAGSDLAGLSTRATRDGDEWSVQRPEGVDEPGRVLALGPAARPPRRRRCRSTAASPRSRSTCTRPASTCGRCGR